MNFNFKHVSGYILVKVQHVRKMKILGGIFWEVRMSPDDASIPLFRLTREVRLSALPATLKKKKKKIFWGCISCVFEKEIDEL